MIHVAGLLDAAVDGGGHSHAVRLRKVVVGLGLAHFRFIPHGEREDVMGQSAHDRSDEPQRGRVLRNEQVHRRGGQAHAVQFNPGCRIPLTSQRIDVCQVRERADPKPVNKIGSTPIDDIADLKCVLPVLRNREDEHGIGMVTEAIHRRQHIAAGAKKGQAGVQESGDRVGQELQQGPRLHVADDRLARLSGEAVVIAVVVEDLTVDQDGQRRDALRLSAVRVSAQPRSSPAAPR